MPEGFQYPANTDVWHRLQWDLAQHSRGAHFMESIFRLKPGVTIEAANNELRALTKRLGRENPSTNAEYTARAVPLATEVVGFFRPALFALFGAAGVPVGHLLHERREPAAGTRDGPRTRGRRARGHRPPAAAG